MSPPASTTTTTTTPPLALTTTPLTTPTQTTTTTSPAPIELTSAGNEFILSHLNTHSQVHKIIIEALWGFVICRILDWWLYDQEVISWFNVIIITWVPLGLKFRKLWSSGKGKGKESTQEGHSKVIWRWWMVNILSLMLYIKFGWPTFHHHLPTVFLFICRIKLIMDQVR